MTEFLEHFSYSHLPMELQEVSHPCAILANQMDEILANPEFSNGMIAAEYRAGLRKLLEAKDCFVRAAVHQQKAMKAKYPEPVTRDPDAVTPDEPLARDAGL